MRDFLFENNTGEIRMKRLVLIGGGGHCKSVLDTVLRTGTYIDIVITDPDIEKNTLISGVRVVGDDDLLPEIYKSGFTDACITVGALVNPEARRRICDRVKGIGFNFPAIIDPSAVVSDSSKIGEGSFIGKNAVVNADAVIGDHCIINSGAIVEHECIIGDFSHISVGAVLCGNVNIGSNCLIGAGCKVKQGVSIGNNSIVGIGSTVLHDVEPGRTVYGLVK